MKINIRGPLGTKLGYGHCCAMVALEFMKEGDEVALFNLFGNIDLSNPEHHQYIEKAIKNQASFDYNCPSLLIWHEHSLSEHVGNGKKTALTFFEMNKLDDRQIHHLNFPDHLFVASTWARNVLLDNGVSTEITVAPMGVDRSTFNEDNSNSHEFKSTRFLNIGKMEKRKGHDILIEAFNKAFQPNDPVELLMAWNNPFLNEGQKKEWYDLYSNSPLGGNIRFQNTYLEEDRELAALIRSSDCCVFPTRAEGFGLPILQSMSCGRQIITTNYSAHTEFCNPTNSLLIEVDELEDAHDDIWFHGQGQWAALDDKVDELVELMRGIHKKKQEFEDLTNYEGIKTSKEFSWKSTVEKIKEGLK